MIDTSNPIAAKVTMHTAFVPARKHDAAYWVLAGSRPPVDGPRPLIIPAQSSWLAGYTARKPIGRAYVVPLMVRSGTVDVEGRLQTAVGPGECLAIAETGWAWALDATEAGLLLGNDLGDRLLCVSSLYAALAGSRLEQAWNPYGAPPASLGIAAIGMLLALEKAAAIAPGDGPTPRLAFNAAMSGGQAAQQEMDEDDSELLWPLDEDEMY